MEPNLKMILAEMQRSKEEFSRRFDDHDAKWERRFADLNYDCANQDTAVDTHFEYLESACGVLQNFNFEHVHAEQDSRVTALEAAATDLGTWHSELEGIVNDLSLKVQKIAKHYDSMLFDNSLHQPGIYSTPTLASAQPLDGTAVNSPSGHGVAQTTRDLGSGVMTTWTHVPAKGMSPPSRSHIPLPSLRCISHHQRPTLLHQHQIIHHDRPIPRTSHQFHTTHPTTSLHRYPLHHSSTNFTYHHPIPICPTPIRLQPT
jgi:hypothetical protein